ncbi:hypothetical protein L1887_31736 [Cichorium endivia]|nr:hypothetical protein L1887_31736 [Cichorium endivia]
MANNNTDHVPRVLVNRVSKQAVFPSDFILSSAKTITLHARGGTIEVPTDLRFTVPVGVLIKFVPIPDMSQQFEVAKGFISSGIEAPVLVRLWNFSRLQIEVKAGDEIARLDFSGRTSPEFIDVTPDFD